MIYKVFKSGKYAGQTYLEVWQQNPGYFVYLADNYGKYWKQACSALENYDKQVAADKPVEDDIGDDEAPPIELVREYYKTVPICGFDMSDHIASIYADIPTNRERMEYLRSLEHRNSK